MYLNYIFLFFGIAHVVSGLVTPFALHKRIYGGKKADAGSHIYEVSVYNDKNYRCAGNLISTKFVLTAAHCIADDKNKELPVDKVTIGYGSTSLKDQTKAKVKKITFGTGFIKSDGSIDYANDIAVVEIEEIKFSDKVGKIPIYSKSIGANVDATIAGWGKIDDGSMPNDLYETQVKTGGEKECKDVINGFKDNNQGVICVPNSLTPGKSTCSKDSGSGLIIKDGDKGTLAGLDLARANGDCGDSKAVHFYVNVLFHKDFIEKTTGLKDADLGITKEEQNKSLNTGMPIDALMQAIKVGLTKALQKQ